MSVNLEIHRTKASKYLKKLISTLQLHLPETKALHHKSTEKLCKNLLMKLSNKLDIVNHQTNNLEEVSHKREAKKSKFGIYLDTIYKLFLENSNTGMIL